MDSIIINRLDELYEQIKDGDESSETLKKIFSEIARLANISDINGNIYDKVLNNDKNTSKQCKIISACIIRLLWSNYNLVWNDINTRLKTVKFLDGALTEEYKAIGIKPDDQSHKKLNTLRDCEAKMYREFRALEDGLVNINHITEFRNSFMRVINNIFYKLFIETFISSSLISKGRLNNLFESIREYQSSDLSEKVNYYQNVEKVFKDYLDGSHEGGVITHMFIYNLFNKVLNVVRKDFENNDVIKSAKVELFNLERKYQFHIRGNKLELKFLLKNAGPGYAYNVKTTIDIDRYLEITNNSINIGNLQPKEMVIVFEATVKEIPSNDVAIAAMVSVTWQDYSKNEYSVENIFDLKSQKIDVDWESLIARQPYSLEAIETEDELVGRSEVINNLYSKLTTPKIESSIISGQKRVGKTSIAKTIENKIKAINKYIVVFIRIGDLDKTSPNMLVKTLGVEIVAEIAYINKFQSIEKPEFDSSLAPLVRYLKNINHSTDGYRFLIIIDEFDEIPNDFYHPTSISDTFFHNIRSLSSEGNIGFVLVGGENMQIIKQSTDKLNKFNTFRVDYFDKLKRWKDFQDLIRKPVINDIEFSDDAILKLYDYTEGNPFFTKLICKTIYNNCCESRNSYVSSEDVDLAIIETIESIDTNHINHFWLDGIVQENETERDSIETQRRKFLVAFAEIKKVIGERYVSKKELEESEIIKKDVALNQMLSSFVNREILIEDMGTYRIKPRFVEKWLTENSSKLSTSFINENAINELKKRESESYVKEIELMDLCNTWWLYRSTKVSPTEVRNWLDQFKNNIEKRLMFKLLLNVKFYNGIEIREKLRVIHNAVKTTTTHSIKTGEKARRDIILTSFGSIAKSGASLARIYAHENGILAANVISFEKIKDSLSTDNKVSAIVIIDDIIGSGDTALQCLGQLNSLIGEELYKNDIKVFITSICSTEKAFKIIENSVTNYRFEVIVNSVDILHEEDQWHSPKAKIFETLDEIEEAKKIVLNYGKKLKYNLPMGHGENGLLVVFQENCPDNSLAILWDSSDKKFRWTPLFQRITS